MNCFDRTERALFQGAELPQGFDSALQALLTISSAGYSGSDTHANFARETVYRWRTLNPHFVAAANQRVNAGKTRTGGCRCQCRRSRQPLVLPGPSIAAAPVKVRFSTLPTG